MQYFKTGHRRADIEYKYQQMQYKSTPPPTPNANTVQATHMRMHSCTLLHVSQMQSTGNMYQLTTGAANTNKIELNINMLTVHTY
jgi:hypothetical protein